MALTCWSNASPHWMAALLPLAYRRAEPTMSSSASPQMGAAQAGVMSRTPSHSLVDAAGPAVHELMVVQVLGNDDVQPGARQRRVGSGPQLQMIGRTRAPPGEARVDGDDARPHLHALHQPVAYVAVGVRGERLVAPHDDHLGRAVGGIGVAQLVRHGGVGYGEVAQGRHGTADARHVAGEPGEEQRGDVRRLQGGLAEQGHQPVDVAARAMHAHDGLGAVFLADGLDLFFYEVVRLVPRDALELRRVAAVFARTLHGVQHPVGVVHDFGQIQAAHAQLAVREGAQGIALHMVQLAVLGVEQNAAAVMAAGRRILVGARDGEAVLLPRELRLRGRRHGRGRPRIPDSLPLLLAFFLAMAKFRPSNLPVLTA